MKTKEEYSELYYGKENLMNEGYPGEELVRGEERPMVNDAKVKGSMYLQTIHDKELLEESQRQIEILGLDINSASDCQKAIEVAKRILNKGGVMVNDAKVKKVKPKRFHVDLSPEQGESFTELAEKMGLTLNAVVKLFLMQPWKKYQFYGFDYIYLGVADNPKALGEIPF